MDIENLYYLEVLRIFDRNDVRHILIGGLAVGYHGYQRFTGDMDLWLEPNKENLDRLYKTLIEVLKYPADVVNNIRDKRKIDLLQKIG